MPSTNTNYAGYGLEIWVTDTCTGSEKAVVFVQRKISEEMKTSEKMKNAQNKTLATVLPLPTN